MIFIFCYPAIAIDDITYKMIYNRIHRPFEVQIEIPVNGYSIGFACVNSTLKKMQDTFNENSMEILNLPTVRETKYQTVLCIERIVP